MVEIDYLLKIDSDGIVEHEDNDAVLHQLTEWWDTAIGEVWGNPAWGNPIQRYKHLPVNDDTAGVIEASLGLKVSKDLPNLSINGIKAVPYGSDIYYIQISCPYLEKPFEKMQLISDS